MAQVAHQISIVGPIDRVFDIVTTTRHWPSWHPATIAVSGVAERPLALGDIVRERAQIGARVYEGNWSVVEHVRPARVVLRSESGRIQIAYAFEASGDTVTFTRTLEFQPENFADGVADPDQLAALMERQSALALQQLKALVETILEKDS
jgi:hypothetical protein